jgi:hypothetical protein
VTCAPPGLYGGAGLCPSRFSIIDLARSENGLAPRLNILDKRGTEGFALVREARGRLAPCQGFLCLRAVDLSGVWGTLGSG